jgi:hypothetical protein
VAGQEQPRSNILHASLQVRDFSEECFRLSRKVLTQGRSIGVRSGALCGPRSADVQKSAEGGEFN